MRRSILIYAFITGLISSITALAAEGPAVAFGTRHGVALRNNGEVLTWGENLFCQLGRPSSTNSVTVPALVMRNVKEIASANTHNFALTNDGKVYAWGGNPLGTLGLGHEYEQCEGPALVESLADKTIRHISTGYDFAIAVSSTGDLYCSGDNGVLQCPGAKGRTNVFVRVPFPELAGKVESATSGTFHTLVRTTDGKMYAFGRGREGQLGHGRMVNGFSEIPGLTDVVSYSAGIWHSAAVKLDGTVWVWGSDNKSQLCDGATTNRATPAQVALSASAKVIDVVAAGHTTVMRTSGGALYACGDNDAGLLGLDKQPVVARPTQLPAAASATMRFSMAAGSAAVSPDGCAVRVSGVLTTPPNLSLCGPKSSTPQPTLVREYPKGGESGCWTPRVEEDAVKNPKWLPLLQAMLEAEDILRRNAAFMAAPQPSRFRTSISAGPSNESGARMHIKVVPERKQDLTRLWTGTCNVIPQVDRIGGAIGQISIFFNTDARGQFIGAGGQIPKLTGRVGGYPEYNNWVLITRDDRLPWIPETLADKLDAIATKRERALADWKRERANSKPPDATKAQSAYEMLKKTDPTGAEKFLQTIKETTEDFARREKTVWPARTAQLEKRVNDVKAYRASFTPEQLRLPAVIGDPTGEEKRRMDAKIAALRVLPPEVQKQPALRNAHMERISPEIDDLMAQYELTNLKPGPADRAISVKPDSTFPNFSDPNRIQLIAIRFPEWPDARAKEIKAWEQRIKESFDLAGLAALLK